MMKDRDRRGVQSITTGPPSMYGENSRSNVIARRMIDVRVGYHRRPERWLGHLEKFLAYQKLHRGHHVVTKLEMPIVMFELKK
jgi:hypothetical protein